MSASRRERVEELFEAALELPGVERDAWLDAAAAGDGALRAEVAALLAAHEMSGILEAELPRTGPSAPEQRRIGVYRVIRELGRGGMGVVYLVERDDGQFRRRAALKLLRAGPDAAELRERFQAERQILASLDHPNIAQLLDGGVTDGHLPYLVMEYVEGLPITEYCDRHRSGIEERLRLFQGVCAAVHHAHSNLVLHRDLKPGNVMVTASGQVKLLDFGIAKLLNPALSGVPLPVTRTGLRALTPEYASPEQFRGEPLSTASDVYALGVLLYELMTGRRPYEVSTRPLEEAHALVCEREPERPSSVVARRDPVTGKGGELEPLAVGAARDASPERLRQTLKGDLDAIVMMALRKEPSRRYGSADLLAADIGRYLEGLPVLAHQGSRRYRTARFLRRHRRAALASGLVAVSLTVGAGIALWQAAVADRERDRAEAARAEALEALAQSEEVTSFLLGLFHASDPEESLGDTVTARELLARGVARAEELAGQPLVQARMLEVMGRVHRGLGEYDRARPLLLRSLALREEHAPESDEVAASLMALGDLLLDVQDFAEAGAVFERGVAIARRRPPGENDLVAQGLVGLGRVARDLGDYDRAEAYLRDALELRRTQRGPEHDDVVRTEGLLANVLHNKGDYDRAEEIYRRTLALRRERLGEVHPEVATNLIALASVHAARDDRFDRAETLHREALEIRRRVYGDEHPAVAKSMAYVAATLSFQGRYEEAEPLLLEVRELHRRLLGPRHTEVAADANGLGLLLLRTGRLDEAESHFQEAASIYAEALGEDHHFVAAVVGNLGRVAQARGDLERAEALFRDALERRRSALGPEHPFTSASELSLAALLRDRGRYAEAETLYLGALSSYERRTNTDDEIRGVHEALAVLYRAWGRPEDAERYAAGRP